MKLIYIFAALTVIAWLLYAYTREWSFSYAGSILLGFLIGRALRQGDAP